MTLIPEIVAAAELMKSWRRDIHANPELGFGEQRTAGIVAGLLREFGVDEVHERIGGTGVVGVVRGNRPGNRAIGLRADMDALPMEELPTAAERPHRSTVPGRMHACGHDGHTTMLLGAARHLARHRDFAGTVYLVFQPAEEVLVAGVEGQTDLGGANAMVFDGLFRRFGMQAIFGMHNRPGLPAGVLATKVGPIYAAADQFEIVIHGQGAHAARPHRSIDPVVVTAHVILAVQAIASRFIDPADPVVVSICQLNGGSNFNVIPDEVKLVGTVRTLNEATRARVVTLLRQISEGIGNTFGATVEVHYQDGHPPLLNDPDLTPVMFQAMEKAVGEAQVQTLPHSGMGGEDFAWYARHLPVGFILIGNGTEGVHGRSLHNTQYDFNDEILATGASYWVRLAETMLGAEA